MLDEVTDFCRLVLIRHPELDADAAGRAVGAGEAELSRRGVARVRELIARLEPVPIDAIVAADVSQASGPARALGESRGVEPTLEPRLRDQSMGDWEGRVWEEVVAEDREQVREFFASFAEVKPPNGETLGEAVERALAWWTQAAPELRGKTVVVFAAGSVLAGFAAAMLGMRLGRCLSLQLPHGGIGIMDVFANGVRITAWHADALATPPKT